MNIKGLGSGTYGSTQLWHLPELEEPVVLKVVYISETWIEDIERETQMMKALDGAGGAPYFLGTYPLVGGIFMSYLGADTLSDAIYKHANGDERIDDMTWLLVIK